LPPGLCLKFALLAHFKVSLIPTRDL